MSGVEIQKLLRVSTKALWSDIGLTQRGFVLRLHRREQSRSSSTVYRECELNLLDTVIQHCISGISISSLW
jgi:hypothetical protein